MVATTAILVYASMYFQSNGDDMAKWSCEKVCEVHDGIEPDEYGCKIWPGLYGEGYPRVHVAGEVMRVGKIILERKLGRKLESGMFVLHTCDYPPCVNAQHLYEGTAKDNARDRMERNPESFTRIVVSEKNLAAIAAARSRVVASRPVYFYTDDDDKYWMYGLRDRLNPRPTS